MFPFFPEKTLLGIIPCVILQKCYHLPYLYGNWETWGGPESNIGGNICNSRQSRMFPFLPWHVSLLAPPGKHMFPYAPLMHPQNGLFATCHESALSPDDNYDECSQVTSQILIPLRPKTTPEYQSDFPLKSSAISAASISRRKANSVNAASQTLRSAP